MAETLTYRQVGESLGISRQRVFTLHKLGKLKALTPEAVHKYREEWIPRKEYYEKKKVLVEEYYKRHKKHFKRVEEYQAEQALQLKRIADTLQLMVGTQVGGKMLDEIVKRVGR